jgi:hypothetical protein
MLSWTRDSYDKNGEKEPAKALIKIMLSGFTCTYASMKYVHEHIITKLGGHNSQVEHNEVVWHHHADNGTMIVFKYVYWLGGSNTYKLKASALRLMHILLLVKDINIFKM